MEDDFYNEFKLKYVGRYNELCKVMDEGVNRRGDKRSDEIPRLIGELNGYLNVLGKEEDPRIVYIKRVHAMRKLFELTEGYDWRKWWYVNNLERELRMDLNELKEDISQFNKIRFVLREIEWRHGKGTYDKVKYWVRHYKNEEFVKDVLSIVEGKKTLEEVDDTVEYVTG